MPQTLAAAAAATPQGDHAIAHLCFLPVGDEELWPAAVFDDFGGMMRFFKTRNLFFRDQQKESCVVLDYLEHVRSNKKGPGNDRVAVLLGHKTPIDKTLIFSPTGELDFASNLAKAVAKKEANKDLKDAMDIIEVIIRSDTKPLSEAPSQDMTFQGATENVLESTAPNDTSQDETVQDATEHLPETTTVPDDSSQDETIHGETEQEPEICQDEPIQDVTEHLPKTTTAPDDSSQDETIHGETEQGPVTSTASVDSSQDESVLNTSFEESEAMNDTLSFISHPESMAVESPKKPRRGRTQKAAVTLGKKKLVLKAANRTKAAAQKKATTSHKRKGIKFFHQNAVATRHKKTGKSVARSQSAAKKSKAPNAKILETPERTSHRLKNNATPRQKLIPHSPADSTTSTTNPWALPIFSQVRSLFQQVGFKFQNNYDAFPNVDPSKKEFCLDRDYFGTATRMRIYLCAYGIDCENWCKGYEWTDDEKELIHKWVRMAIVPALRHAKEIPEEARKPVTPAELHRLLTKLGFKYRSSGDYFLPGVKPLVKNGLSMNGKPLKGKNGMLVHLARFGLPPKTVENLNKMDRMRLELSISDCRRDLDTFVKIEPEEDDPPIFGDRKEVESKAPQYKRPSSVGVQSTEISLTASSSKVAAPEPQAERTTQQLHLSFASSSGSVDATLVTNSTIGEQHQVSPRSHVAAVTNESDSKVSPSQSTVAEELIREDYGLIVPLRPLTQPPCESRTESPSSDDCSYDEVRNDTILSKLGVFAAIRLPKSSVEMADRHCIVATAMNSDAHYQDETPCRRVKLFIESPNEKISHDAAKNSPLTSPDITQVVPNGQASPFDLEFGAEIGGMLDMSDDQVTQVSDCIEKVVCGSNSPKDGSPVVQDNTPARCRVEQSARKRVCYDVVSTPPDGSPLIFFDSQPMENEESMPENSQDLLIEIDSVPASPKTTDKSMTDIGIESDSAAVAVKNTVAKNDEWSMVRDKMKLMGWRHANGSGLVTHFFLPPGGKLQRQGGRLDEDYVEDIFGMQKYAYKHLGWGGDEDFLRDLKELESTRPAEGGRLKRRQTNLSVESHSTQKLVKPQSDRQAAVEDRTETQVNGNASESDNEAAKSIPESKNTKGPAKRAATSTREPQSRHRLVRPRLGQKRATEARVKIQTSGSVNESDKEVAQSSPESVTRQRPAQRAVTTISKLVSKKAKTKQLRAGHPDRMKTIGEKLKACQRALDTQNSLDTLSGVAGAGVAPEHQTLFQRNVDSLCTYLRSVVETKGAHGEKWGDPANLYICGAPGVGKTSAVQWACKETKLWASEKQGLENLLLPCFCFINADDMQTSSNALKKITEIIADALSLKGKRRTREGVEKALEGGPRSHSCLVMVVDEIDLLLSERSKRSAVPSSSSETALKMLCEWSTAQNFRFALIGISNSIGNQHVKRLQRFGLAHNTITFSSYHKEDLIQVVQDRVGCNVIDPQAVEFIASKVAASCGDARKLLELTSSAVSKCQASLISGKETTCGKPIVTLKHMMQAVKDTIQKHADIIDGLPQMAKIILCVAVTLTQAGPDWNVIRLGKLKNFCSAALREDMYDEDLTVDTFAGLVQQLFDAGLLLSGHVEPMDVSMHDYSSLYSMPIRLGVQLYDVESALEQTLGEQDFYRDLLQKIRSTDLKNVKK